MKYDKQERKHPICLECGDRIRYGRPDKKFCCDDCRNKHYNSLSKNSRAFRRRILKLLDQNYDILDNLFRKGVFSADLAYLATLGFTSGISTSYRKNCKHDEYTCFDIRYLMTRTRVFSISKIQNVSLSLSIVWDDDNQ